MCFIPSEVAGTATTRGIKSRLEGEAVAQRPRRRRGKRRAGAPGRNLHRERGTKGTPREKERRPTSESPRTCEKSRESARKKTLFFCSHEEKNSVWQMKLNTIYVLFVSNYSSREHFRWSLFRVVSVRLRNVEWTKAIERRPGFSPLRRPSSGSS